ncbi:SMI1/KNR4 family protein [Sphingobacterium sp. FBM7-1]|uniref:SMI1/KNR4 family protein n=1 Tax=Sphingobacterium sp. FBM7-1 TaxID=2886688 RepID=UPI001D1172AA|nr:SMI1/KNR4 family protein [Sphingobacterium sp. FBM7-1]MCC2599401.1 SMI1/KNR4 family protein [Sphingobacterium sp. FBM7-1]
MPRSIKTNLEQQLAELEQLIVDKHPAAQFKAGIDSNDLQAFENTNGVKIPQELVTFYNWHNGVYIDSKLYLPSLYEAYHLFKAHKHAHKPHSDIKDVAPSTLEELEKFLSPTDENSQQYHAIWLPIFVIDHKPYYDKEDLYSYLLPTANSKIMNDASGITKLSDSAIFLTSYRGNQYIVKSLHEVISSLIDRLNPSKMTFKEKIKGFFEIFGRLFERF